MSMTPSQPYLVRAIYEWIVDNALTPYVLVNAEHDATHVPRQYVENGKIVLNLGPVAVNDLDMANDYITFNARFGGKAVDVSFPVASVLAIYAKENGQGMVFNESEGENPPPEPEPDKPGRPSLKLVK
jgi:stringent starvation protein B